MTMLYEINTRNRGEGKGDYEQGLLDGAKLMFKMFTESIDELGRNLFDGVNTFSDVEQKLKERE